MKSTWWWMIWGAALVANGVMMVASLRKHADEAAANSGIASFACNYAACRMTCTAPYVLGINDGLGDSAVCEKPDGFDRSTLDVRMSQDQTVWVTVARIRFQTGGDRFLSVLYDKVASDAMDIESVAPRPRYGHTAIRK